MTANKRKSIRAALCWNKEISKLARQHNNANILSIPSRFISKTEAIGIVETFLKTDFEGGRHQGELKKNTMSVVKFDVKFDEINIKTLHNFFDSCRSIHS